jgi:hypothetical protein
MDADRFVSRLNPVLIALLHSPLHFLASGGLMTLRYRGRKSGRTITIPCGYQRWEDRVDVLVSKAPRKKWWRNFETPGRVELRVRGQRLEGKALIIAADESAFREAFQYTFNRLPFLPPRFDIDDYDRSVGLSDAQLAILEEQARLVSIEL